MVEDDTWPGSATVLARSLGDLQRRQVQGGYCLSGSSLSFQSPVLDSSGLSRACLREPAGFSSRSRLFRLGNVSGHNSYNGNGSSELLSGHEACSPPEREDKR